MSRFQSLSAWFRRLSARERRVVAAGALVSSLALLAVWAVLPFAHRWQQREAAIAAQETRLMQLRMRVEGESAARRSLTSRQNARASVRRQLLTGSTPALAASNLQALLQAYADSSRINLDRVDPVADPGAATDQGLPAIPVRLSGQGDIYGLTGLLNRLQYGEKLLVIDELSVNAGGIAGYKPDLLVFSVRLHGTYSPE
jgi:type II secretion system (T2SS) protein M